MPKPTISTFAKLAIQTIPATTAKRLDFETFSPGVTATKANANKNRGELDMAINRTRTVMVACAPRLTTQPTAAELALLLPWMCSGANTTASGVTTYGLGDNVEERKLYFDDGNGKTHIMNNVCQKSISFSTANPERMLTITSEMQSAMRKSDNTGSIVPSYKVDDGSDPFPVGLVLDDTTVPFCLADASGFDALGVATTGGIIIAGNSTVSISDFTLNFDNMTPERFMHSFYNTLNIKTDRRTTVTFNYPEGIHPTFYNALEDGVPITIKLATGNYTLEIVMPMVQIPREPQDFGNRTEVMNSATGICYKDGTNPSVTFKLKAA